MNTLIKKTLCTAAVLTFSTAAFANPSTFQNSCSNISFAYANNQATLNAVCLRTNGTANQSSLTLVGISNQNGELVQSGTDASSFQQSCGNIQIAASEISTSGSGVTLSALCRTRDGRSVSASLPLTGISNNNGTLSY